MTRPTEDQTNLKHARVASERSTCVRRSVGCVLVDENNHVISTGRNGVPKGQPHCNEGFPCPGADAPSGTNLVQCRAIHAEINAITHCKDPSKVDTIYITDSPCKFCCDALMALPNAKRIVAAAPYAGSGESKERWEAMGRTWEIQPIIAAHWFGIDNATKEKVQRAYYIKSNISGYYFESGINNKSGKFTRFQPEAFKFDNEFDATDFLRRGEFPGAFSVVEE